VYAKWFANYRREDPNLEITYEPIGSEAGIRKLLKGEVDFGASDSPEVIRTLAPAEESKYLLLPSVIGAVVPIVNLPGFTGEIAFTKEALEGIYLGRIKKWNDPLLQQANRGLHLPNLDIVVVQRADGSGTSYAWSAFLGKPSLDPQWPVGKRAMGNDGVAKLVKELGGSIGYVEFIYALQNHLSYGKVRNRNGDFVAASLESMAIANMGDDLKVSLIDSPKAGAYPITTYTWLIVPKHKLTAIKGFLKWMLGPGQTQAAALGYLALPRDIMLREQKLLATNERE